MDGAIVADNIKTSASHKKKNAINVTTNPRLTAMMIYNAAPAAPAAPADDDMMTITMRHKKIAATATSSPIMPSFY